jgi:hypothetical protein
MQEEISNIYDWSPIRNKEWKFGEKINDNISTVHDSKSIQ